MLVANGLLRGALALGLAGPPAVGDTPSVPGQPTEPDSNERSAADSAETGVPEPSTEDRAEAKRLYADGSSLFRQGRYLAAIAAFDRGFNLSGDANFLFNMALAYDRLDAFDDALETLRRYRAATPEADHADVDERERGLRLRRAAAEAKASQTDENAPVEPRACPEPAVPTEPEEPPGPKPIMTPLAIGLAALTGVAAVAATVLGSMSLAETREARDRCSDRGGDLRCSAGAADALSRARRTAIGADVSIGVAAAAGVGLVAVIITNVIKRRKNAATSVDVAAGRLKISF